MEQVVPTTTAELDCPICLLTCKFPACLPCGHIFCFLCIKGVQNRRCAMCRREIPPEFLERPCLVNGVDDIFRMTKCTGYQWFYEGRNGWWQYDDRTSKDIEEAYHKNEKSCTILVAGNVYIVDLENMMQQRQNEPSRCRRVKRDLATVPKKGVAGLRIEGNAVTTEASTSSDIQSGAVVTNENDVSSSTSRAASSSINLLSPAAAALNIAAAIPDSTVNSDNGSPNDGEHLNGENELILNERDSSSESANTIDDDVRINNDIDRHRPIDNYEQVLIDLLRLQVQNPASDDENEEHIHAEHREQRFDENRQT